MKKAILLSILTVAGLLTVITNAKAQKGIYVGAQAARQLSTMFNENDVEQPGADYKSKFTMTYGLSGGYNFNKHMGIGTEVTYSKTKQRYIDAHSSYTQKFSYLKIPVLFTYNTNPDKKFMFTAKAGPQLGILLKSEITGASNSALNGNTKYRYNNLTFGAMAGAGIRMRLVEKIYLDAGLRLDGTISDTEDKSYTGYSVGRGKSRDLNAGLEVGIKYFF